MVAYDWDSLYKLQRRSQFYAGQNQNALKANNFALAGRTQKMAAASSWDYRKYLDNYRKAGAPGDPTQAALSKSANDLNVARRNLEAAKKAGNLQLAAQRLATMRIYANRYNVTSKRYNLANPAAAPQSVAQQANALEGKAGYQTMNEVLGKLTPFDPASSLASIQAKRNYDVGLQDITGQENLLNQQYTMGRSQINEQAPQLARQLLSNYAGRGMANSSGYGQATTDQQADIARSYSDLDMQKQQGTAALTSGRAALQAGYNNNLSDILFQTTQNLSANAGKLNLDPKALVYAELAKRLLAKGTI